MIAIVLWLLGVMIRLLGASAVCLALIPILVGVWV
jgi:hypothetical protein